MGRSLNIARKHILIENSKAEFIKYQNQCINVNTSLVLKWLIAAPNPTNPGRKQPARFEIWPSYTHRSLIAD